ncbi:MAG TPA: acetyl-CoA carboxylase biotin carboxyl carrier protein subunit [Bacteroidetes bacterium]|jgi:glutaconyl-CoA/methylmalonyl-CoA decarboxylase subunit gamma|nr:acetyl-CoA carboxylase biotin carboxyl carrier protein subunit [Bacteroidota bacterium]
MKKLMITVNGKRYEVDVEVVQDDEAIEVQPPFKPPVRTMNSYVTPVTTPLPTKSKPSSADKKSLTSPINGVVLEIPVKEGQAVKENDILFVMEAMKMKTNISSPQTGKIKAVKVKVGDTIEAGKVLLTFE